MKEKIQKWLKSTEWFAKIKGKSMTSDDWAAFEAAVKEKFGISMQEAADAMKAAPSAEIPDNLKTAFSALIEASEEEGDDDDEEDDDEEELGGGASGAGAGTGADSDQPTTEKVLKAAMKIIKNSKNKNQIIAKLMGEEEPKGGKVVEKDTKTLMICGPGTTDKHLFGIPTEMFSMGKRWNRAAASLTALNSHYTKAEQQELQNDFDALGSSVSDRFKTLFANGQLPVMLAGNLNYADLASELGAYYNVRRQDAIIDYIMKLRSLSELFPVHYGVQDEETLVNVFEGKSFSQAFQSGRVFGGNFKFQPVKAKVKDVMFKYKFSDLKDLERQYIGYLNTSGSDPIKWSFIEWIMVMSAKIQVNEREKRRVKGCRIEPTATKASHFMYASDGILTTLDRLAEAAKPSIFVFTTLNAYTASTILEYVRSFVRSVYRMYGTLDGFALYMNELDIPDFKQAYREKYGSDSNFSGEKMEIKDFPLPKIVGIPNMGPLRQDMILCEEGRIEILENVPGEFFAFNFQRDFEELYAMSYGKEGTHAFPGKQYDSKAALIADNGRHTRIFMNQPASLAIADQTTLDGSLNEIFKTIANTGATALTDITGAVDGIAYKVICGSTTNATTIAKANKFSTITAAYTPTAVGDYIKVIYDPTGDKFYEIERKVGGVLTVNSALTAPEYVES